MSDAEIRLPLAGIRLLELGHTVMGPTCGLVLADLGAEVYKVERTGRGDDTRRLGTRELLHSIGLDDVEIESLLADQIVGA